MTVAPRFAHIVFQTSQPKEMIDWYCSVLAAHVVYEDDGLGFITFDDEHHRVAFIKAPVPLEPKTPTTAAMHHAAYTFTDIDDLLERYVQLRSQGILPAVCIAHGVTLSMYYRDPDRNMVEIQVDRFAEPDQATAYMNGPEYAADSVGPAFDPEQLLQARRAGASAEELCDRAWAVKAGLPDPMPALIGVS
ncbi:VOC family protein [Frankia sp. AgB1.9]|uniref:VOC family protein n=1 Tax=unclassified Frankia TaxID=2632575 RepID=UPI001932FA8F|nr:MULTISPECIES: VOC family protein [unclassified Frankia]MBL7486838.1 VOC family protein [Frankia sp. AgW1.1]MBL7549789.1 VOC family protein [Frankia sp. AgB1.9]MBL7622901.1 VOC family protein [Frankia sp. AgB1.8]